MRRGLVLLLGIFAVLGLAAPAGAAPAPSGTPPEVARARKAWPTPNHDYGNTRGTVTSPIRRKTVRDLDVQWDVSPDGMGSLTTAPVIIGKTVYLADSNGVVFALDRDSGEVRWKSKGTGFNIGPYGVAVGDGRIYTLHGSDGVTALDLQDGTELWTRQVTPNESTGVDIQPQVFGGQVLVSTVPVSTGGIYHGGDHGVISALDAKTGEVNWQFDTVDSPDLWGNPSVNSGGGAWYPPAIDAKRGVAYFGIANPAPFPGTAEFPNGSSRPGANLYTDSIVALDLKTGKLRWYHQVTSHDIFDRDQVHAQLVPVHGRDVVVSSGKSGVVVGLSPTDGKVLWTTQVGRHHMDDLTALNGPAVVSPGTYGGVLTPPAAAGGTVYVPVVDAPVTLKPNETAYFGADVTKGRGLVVAVSAKTGKVQWQRRVPGQPLGGATVVNDLVLTATLSGTIVALDRSTGKIVWRKKAPGGVNGWMSVAGDTIVVPVGNARPPRILALSTNS